MIKFIYIYYRKNIAIQKLTTANQPYLCVALVAIQIKLSKLFPVVVVVFSIQTVAARGYYGIEMPLRINVSFEC